MEFSLISLSYCSSLEKLFNSATSSFCLDECLVGVEWLLSKSFWLAALPLSHSFGWRKCDFVEFFTLVPLGTSGLLTFFRYKPGILELKNLPSELTTVLVFKSHVPRRSDFSPPFRVFWSLCYTHCPGNLVIISVGVREGGRKKTPLPHLFKSESPNSVFSHHIWSSNGHLTSSNSWQLSLWEKLYSHKW